MPDYEQLIDAETWAFIERTSTFYPPDTVDYTIAEQRDIYDHMCREFSAGYPEGVSARDSLIDSPGAPVPIRIYRSAAPDASAVVLFFHGGGFMLGGLVSHDDMCAELCDRTGYEVVAIDYRLAPEHPHPAAFDDAVAACQWSAATYALPVLLCGDSAGGNLAAALAHRARQSATPPNGQVLIYPALGGDMTKGSYVTHAEAPMLSVRDVEFYRAIRAGGAGAAWNSERGLRDATFDPLNDTDYSRLPPTVIFSAECDPLSSDGETYRDNILAAGGRAVWFEEKGLVHGYLRARHTVARARESFGRIADALRSLGQGEWAW
jgi:acetyl esterase